MAVADLRPTLTPPAATTRTFQWGPGWHNDAWSRTSSLQEAFASAEGSYAAYGYLEGGLQGRFPRRLDISNMGAPDNYGPLLILVTAPVSCSRPIVP